MFPGLLSCKTLKRPHVCVLYMPSSSFGPVLCSHTEGRGSLSLLFWGCPSHLEICHTHTNTELVGPGSACSSHRGQKKAGSGGRALVEIAITFLSPRQDQRQSVKRGSWPLGPPVLMTPTEGRRAFSERRKK